MFDANQKLFDEALAHMREQGEPSIKPDDEEGRRLCEYQNDKGLHCAFWPAIKDYHVIVENRCASAVMRAYPERLHDWIADVDPEIADAIQSCHDDQAGMADFMRFFEREMAELARANFLTYAPPQGN